MKRTILVTGGAGYIGSHACATLLGSGWQCLVLDNFCNSQPAVLDRIAAVAGVRPLLVAADLRDAAALAALFAEHAVHAVLHFAGLKAVGESVQEPALYHDNNVVGTRILLDAMVAAGVRRLVFSSSATVYGEPASLPLTESAPLGATNPYGATKLAIEQELAARCAADPQWRIVALRYFNPVGAHLSGLLGEDPRGTPNNLMPYLVQVAAGLRPELQVYGGDWPTVDGTGVRDYIHVTDLVDGHLAALTLLESNTGFLALNLGTGRGHSVLELVRAFEAATGVAVPYRIVGRRPGDIAASWADPGLARRVLGWEARLGLAEMCRDSWRWQQCLAEQIKYLQ